MSINIIILAFINYTKVRISSPTFNDGMIVALVKFHEQSCLFIFNAGSILLLAKLSVHHDLLYCLQLYLVQHQLMVSRWLCLVRRQRPYLTSRSPIYRYGIHGLNSVLNSFLFFTNLTHICKYSIILTVFYIFMCY